MIGPFGLRQKGTSRARLLPLARALAERGHQIKVLLPPWDSPQDSGQEADADGVVVSHVALPPPFPGVFHPLLARRLAAEALAFRLDVVHCFKLKAYAEVAASPPSWSLRISTRSAIVHCDAHRLGEPRLPNKKLGISDPNVGRVGSVAAGRPQRPISAPVVHWPAGISQLAGISMPSISSRSGSDFSEHTGAHAWPRDTKIGFARRSEIWITPGRPWTVATTNGRVSLPSRARRRPSKRSSCVSTAPPGATL